MIITSVDFGVLLIAMFVVVGSLFVVFGEVTVRRLRNNSETKEALGIEFVGGRDIMNVAMALSIPRSLNRRGRRSRASFMFADADLLYQYTNLFDRVLARLFYWTFVVTVVGIIINTYYF